MNIYQAINKVMAKIGVVGKDSKNQSQGFMYRGIDAVMNAINPALVENKVFVVPEVLEQTREERTSIKRDYNGQERTSTLIYSICKIKFTFYAEDGSHIEAITIGEGMDSGDKATNKAMSIAFKYACFQVFCIPTEEMVDPDAECHEVAPKEKTKKNTEKKEQKQEKPSTQNNMEVFPNPDFITPEQKAFILSELTRTHVAKEDVMKMFGIETLDDIPKTAFEGLKKKFSKTPTWKE